MRDDEKKKDFDEEVAVAGFVVGREGSAVSGRRGVRTIGTGGASVSRCRGLSLSRSWSSRCRCERLVMSRGPADVCGRRNAGAETEVIGTGLRDLEEEAADGDFMFS